MKENKTHASTSRYHNLKAMISLLPLCATLFSVSCGTASHGNRVATDRKLYSLIKRQLPICREPVVRAFIHKRQNNKDNRLGY